MSDLLSHIPVIWTKVVFYIDALYITDRSTHVTYKSKYVHHSEISWSAWYMYACNERGIINIVCGSEYKNSQSVYIEGTNEDHVFENPILELLLFQH